MKAGEGREGGETDRYKAEDTLEIPIQIDREERQKAVWTDRDLTAESFSAVSGY